MSGGMQAIVGAGALAVGGVGFWLVSDPDAAKQADSAVRGAAQSVRAATNFVPTQADYQRVYDAIAESLDAEGYDDGSLAPVLVRLAWHASGTYDKTTGTGGSNFATMRFPSEAAHGANRGLIVARTHLELIRTQFPWISHGDLWTLAGVCAIQESGGPAIPWRAGRIDGFEKDTPPEGRLPDATKAADHVRTIFSRMGFSDQEMVALIGAHALGRCHKERSGFDGPWQFSPTSFSNAFYTLLFSEKWSWRTVGWTGPRQLQDKATGTLIMLPTDYALVQDSSFRKVAQRYAEDEGVFFTEFSAAFAKLLELGVPESQWAAREPWTMKTTSG